MANFNEHALEMSIMELFKDEGYTYVSGDQIHRERTEVLLTDDLKQYLYNRYAKDGITPSEVDSVIRCWRIFPVRFMKQTKLYLSCSAMDLFLIVRIKCRKTSILNLLISTLPKTIFSKWLISLKLKANNQSRIPDGIVFVNGIPSLFLNLRVRYKRIRP